MHYETYLKSGRNEWLEHMSYRIFFRLPLREVNAWPSCYGNLNHPAVFFLLAINIAEALITYTFLGRIHCAVPWNLSLSLLTGRCSKYLESKDNRNSKWIKLSQHLRWSVSGNSIEAAREKVSLANEPAR